MYRINRMLFYVFILYILFVLRKSCVIGMDIVPAGCKLRIPALEKSAIFIRNGYNIHRPIILNFL